MKILSFFLFIAGALVCTSNAETQNIRGVPGVDYPNYFTIPKTSFKCSEQKYIPGFYADTETECQVFHFCFKHREETFLCPTGTTFNQPILACDSWYSSNCSLAPLYYIVNAGPGLEAAGKNLPMLLKLRNKVPEESTSTMASVLEKISSLYEENTEQEIMSALSNITPENLEVSNSGDMHLKNTSQSDIDESSAKESLEADNIPHFDENKLVEEDLPSAGNLEDEFKAESNKDDTEFNDQRNWEPEEHIVYDSATAGYNVGNLHPDFQWKEETGEMNEDFNDYYDYRLRFNNKGAQNGDVGQFPHQNTEQKETFDPREPHSLPPNLETGQKQNQFNKLGEFSKRLLQKVKAPKRLRRKPTYVVLDQNPGFGYPIPFETTSEPSIDTATNLFTESISMDTLVELNTELPDDYSLIENKDNLQEFESESRQGNLGRGAVEIGDSEFDVSDAAGGYNEEQYMNNQEAGYYQNNPYEEYRYETDSDYPSSNLTPEEYDPHSYSSETGSVKFLKDRSDPDEKILAFRKPIEKNSVIVIPDETDIPETSEISDLSTEVNSASATGDENWENEGVESSKTEDSDDDIIVYDDTEQNYEKESEENQIEIGEDQNYGAQERQIYDETYASNSMRQYHYYPDQPRVEHSQIPQDYQMGENEDPRYASGSYYQYVNEYGEPIPSPYENPDLYQMPYPQDPDSFEGSYPFPEGYQPGGYEQAYYPNQPGMPTGASNEYAYDPNQSGMHAGASNEYAYDPNQPEMPAEAGSEYAYDPNQPGMPAEAGSEYAYDPNQPGMPAEAASEYAYDPNQPGMPAEAGSEYAYDPNQPGMPAEAGSEYAYDPNQAGIQAGAAGELAYYPNQPGMEAGTTEEYAYDPNQSQMQAGTMEELAYDPNKPQMKAGTGTMQEHAYDPNQPQMQADTTEEHAYDPNQPQMQDETADRYAYDPNQPGMQAGSAQQYAYDPNEPIQAGSAHQYSYDPSNAIPSGSVDDYTYNSELGYYQNPDGSIFSHEGVEIPKESFGEVAPTDVNAFTRSEVQYAEKPDPSNQFDSSEESASGDPESLDFSPPADSEADNITETINDLDDNVDTGLVKGINEEEDEAFFVIGEDGEEIDPSLKNEDIEFKELPKSVEKPVEDILTEDEFAAKEKQSVFSKPDGAEISSEFSSITEGRDVSDISMPDQELITSQPEKVEIEDKWPEPTFIKDREIPEAPVSSFTHLTTMKPTETNEQKIVAAPSESQFLSNVAFQNSMNFGPYGFGPNMGQQFGMLDSSNRVPFTKPGTKRPSGARKPSSQNLSLKDKVRSMKRGKFGMFKKYMNSGKL